MIVIVVGFVLFLNSFIIINARIPSSCMENTIMVDDCIFETVWLINHPIPKDSTLSIFRYPDDEKTLFIK